MGSWVYLLLAKGIEGCAYFISQTVYHAPPTQRLLRDYLRDCRGAGADPRRVILTFAPCGREKTLAFLRYSVRAIIALKYPRHKLAEAPKSGASRPSGYQPGYRPVGLVQPRNPVLELPIRTATAWSIGVHVASPLVLACLTALIVLLLSWLLNIDWREWFKPKEAPRDLVFTLVEDTGAKRPEKALFKGEFNQQAGGENNPEQPVSTDSTPMQQAAATPPVPQAQPVAEQPAAPVEAAPAQSEPSSAEARQRPLRRFLRWDAVPYPGIGAGRSRFQCRRCGSGVGARTLKKARQ